MEGVELVEFRKCLISEVFKQRPIWDQKDKRHHNRYVLDKCWETISITAKVSKKEARNKWKNIRAEFKKRYVELISKKSGFVTPKDLESEWPFFNSLLFLADQCTPRNMDTNQVDTHTEMQVIVDPDDLDDDIAFPPTPVTSLFADSPTPSGASVSKASDNKRTRTSWTNDVIGNNFVAVEQEKRDLLGETHEQNQLTHQLPVDEDVSFFNSLLPQLKTLDPRKKMLFKMQVQRLLFDFCFDEQHNTHTQAFSFSSNVSSVGSNAFSSVGIYENSGSGDIKVEDFS